MHSRRPAKRNASRNLPRKKTRKNSRVHRYRWDSYTDEQLLDLRFCDLRLTLKHAAIAPQLQRLYQELQSRGIRFKPHVWLSSEWFSPDGVPGFAIPFYLAHPRLARLERAMMQQVEGGNTNWLMRILRHEAGHAFDTAYRVRRRADWRKVFGKASTPYPSVYRPKPTSRRHVLHLGQWYAQTHPTEDFAETFAVWLQPRSSWRHDYADWPVLGKLEYVNKVAEELRGVAPLVKSRAVVEPLRENTCTLREHYRRKITRESVENSRALDAALTRVFKPRAQATSKRPMAASRLLRESQPQFQRMLLRQTRMHPYLIHNVMRMVIERCRELHLTVSGSRRESKRAALSLMARLTFDLINKRRQQYSL